jgi:hypothetical protein
VASRAVPARSLRRRFTLGAGPLKRTSDRVEFLSRVLLLLVLLAAAPAGLAVGAATRAGVQAVAVHQAATRVQQTATLVSDAPDGDGAALVTVPTSAVWTMPDGAARSGKVDAPAGARAGTTVAVWIDPTGRITERPLTAGEVTGQGVVLGVLAGLGLVVLGTSGHLVGLWLLERRRLRRWEAGWAAVAPLWIARFR